MQLQDKVQNLPLESGVYIMKGAQGEILYIGKAKSLRKRVQSYFRETEAIKTKQLASKIKDIEVIVTPTELDALILESTLIKKHRPFYNLQLKDDKRYPYLKLTINEQFPRLLVVRKYQEDGASYFGPFAGKGTVLRALKLLRTTFPLRQCSEKLPDKPCLELQIKRCLGPCINKDVEQDYQQACRDLTMFLEGKHKALMEQLTLKMQGASKLKQFERAALYRDRLKKLEKITEHQEMVIPEIIDQDMIVFFKTDKEEGADILQVRGGKVINNEVAFFERKETEENVYQRVLINYYERKKTVPNKIILEENLEQFPLLKDWFQTKKKQEVTLIYNPKNDLLKVAKRNIEYLKIQNIRETTEEEVLVELKEALGLKYLPSYIEGYDISNTGSQNIIGAKVAFLDGQPDKKKYRHYNIKTVQGKPDDFASMK
ncbi:MAG: excinuclease ABC subunit UvrC, partial [Candidatus Margulisbacteria bacterium]|nr:excinuclease ABC subunit UvrC [Candidatus Margulisiibacteriota bacterium]